MLFLTMARWLFLIWFLWIIVLPYPKNNTVVAYVTLTGDIGYKITWKNITFTIDDVVFTNISVEEGLASLKYNFIPECNYTISGNYVFISDFYNNNFSSSSSEDIEITKTDNITSESNPTPIPHL